MSKLFKDKIFGALFHMLDVGLNNAGLDTIRISALSDEDWDSLFSVANHHEVAPLISDVISNNTTITVPIDVRLKFLGMQEIAQQSYQHHLMVLTELLDFFKVHDIPTMVIKGVSLAQYYPVPSHRKCGDIDIYQFGSQSYSDQQIYRSYGLTIKQSIVGHHTNYYYKDISIENHYQFITTYYGGKTLELNELLEKEANEAIQSEINDHVIFFPSPTLNAIFLPYHMAGHFREEKVTLRQILDWMMFLKNEYGNVEWKFVHEVYKNNNLLGFVNAINGILIHHLGMLRELAFQYEENIQLEQRILSDMMNVSDNSMPGLLGGLRHEWVQYITSGWKYRLFNKNGCVELLKKVMAFMIHHDHFVAKELYPSSNVS